MERLAVAIESLKARADVFRARAADAIPRYSEPLHKEAAHLGEQVKVLEIRQCVRPEPLVGIIGTDH